MVASILGHNFSQTLVTYKLLKKKGDHWTFGRCIEHCIGVVADLFKGEVIVSICKGWKGGNDYEYKDLQGEEGRPFQ